MEFRRLFPDPAPIDVDELLDPLYELGADAPADRPHIIANFAATADGRASIEGSSGELGDDGDRAMFHGLRQRVDAVLAGTTTLRRENYGRVLGTSERRFARAERGLGTEPLACVFSRSGDIPTAIRMFGEPEARIVVFSPTELDTGGIRAQVTTVVLPESELTFTTAMRCLRHEHGIRLLLCEGGPTVFGALLADGLIDELFLTVAPKLVGGGEAPTIAEGPELIPPREMRLRWLLERNGSLYHRYAIER